MTRLLALSLFAVACGGSEAVEELRTQAAKELRTDALAEGDYQADAWVKEREGTCDFVPDEYHGAAHVDAKGDFSAPLPGLECVTSYATGVEVRCSGFGADGRMRGERYEGTTFLVGEIKGDLNGCKRIVVAAVLTQPNPNKEDK